MNILVEPVTYSAVSTDENAADGYYVYANWNYLWWKDYEFLRKGCEWNLPQKSGHGSKRYTQTYYTEVAIPLHIIDHPKRKVFVLNCVDDFPGSLCAKYQRIYFVMKCLIQISELLRDDILDKIFKLDIIEFGHQIYNGNFM